MAVFRARSKVATTYNHWTSQLLNGQGSGGRSSSPPAVGLSSSPAVNSSSFAHQQINSEPTSTSCAGNNTKSVGSLIARSAGALQAALRSQAQLTNRPWSSQGPGAISRKPPVPEAAGPPPRRARVKPSVIRKHRADHSPEPEAPVSCTHSSHPRPHVQPLRKRQRVGYTQSSAHPSSDLHALSPPARALSQVSFGRSYSPTLEVFTSTIKPANQAPPLAVLSGAPSTSTTRTLTNSQNLVRPLHIWNCKIEL
ncbi:hypothetical protein PENSPDRAFT_672334 [Peniophora sp. CONT]|nr:hypothetical protein PENSPDRAFT_672334 [Peniophora sp. CONT]